MKITYLGTSHGVPSATRNTTSFLLEVGENAYIIDAGAPIAGLLMKHNIPYTKIKALFNTHYHVDHFFGGLEFIALCNWYFKDTDLDIFLTEDSAIKNVQNIITDSGLSLDGDRVRMKKVTESFVYDDGTVKVTAVPTLHLSITNRPSFAYIFEAEGKRIMFTGDLAAYLEDFPQVLYEKHFDYVAIECSHPSAENLEEHLKTANCDRVAVTHIFPEDKFEKLEQMKKRLKAELMIPNDGDVFVL